MLIRFMVCDTDTKFLDVLSATLHEMFDPCSIEYMYGPSALEVSLRSDTGGADVLITEIELRGQNAIDIIAKYMRPSMSLQVIYMTSKIQYCTEVYETPHCGFMLKPLKWEKLFRDVSRAIRQLEHSKADGITLKFNGSLRIIKAGSLLYAESRGHVVHVITDSEDIGIYEGMEKFSKRMDMRFLRCHKGYLVNMDRVRQYCGDCFLMDNGERVPISQSRRKKVREVFLAYMGNAAASGSFPAAASINRLKVTP